MRAEGPPRGANYAPPGWNEPAVLRACESNSGSNQFPQHEWKNSTVLVVIDLDWRIDSAQRRNRLLRSVLARDDERHLLLRADVGRHVDVEQFIAFDSQRFSRFAAGELQRQHAHADEIGAVDPFEAFRDDRLDAQKLRAFGRPVARAAGAVFFAAEHDGRHALLLILHRG